MARINAYLLFNGNCREAMNFYQECFGGELMLEVVGNSPMSKQWPSAVHQHILHARLTKSDLILHGSDMSSGSGLQRGNAILLTLSCSDHDEINRFFTRLSAGGEVIHPLHDFYDGTIGSLTDRFGVSWVLKL